MENRGIAKEDRVKINLFFFKEYLFLNKIEESGTRKIQHIPKRRRCVVLNISLKIGNDKTPWFIRFPRREYFGEPP